MKYVTFEKLIIKNFLSIGEEPVSVEFDNGLHVITGLNRDKEDRRNGVGKSTIADALYFAIFGTTLRDIKKDFITNNITEGKTVVELTFTVDDPYYGVNNFHVIRTLKPSKCTIYKNGVDKTRDTIQNTGIYIENILSSSPEIFQNCVIMTLNNHIPFMAKNKVDKRKFIERIFNLEVFSKMLNDLRSEYNETKQNFNTEITRLEESQNYLKIQTKQRETFTDIKINKLSNLREKIQTNITKIENYKKELNEILKLDATPYFDKSRVIDEKIAAEEQNKELLYTNLVELKNKIDLKRDILSKIGTDEEKCPVCLRSIEEHHKEYIETEKSKIQEEINNYAEIVAQEKDNLVKTQQKLKTLNEAKQVVLDKINQIQIKQRDKERIEKTIAEINSYIKEQNNDIANIENETYSFDNAVEELEKKVETTKQNIENIKKVLDLLEVVKFVISEEGVKSFIVKKILRNFNSKLTYYLKKLDSNSICIFNEYFEEEIVNEKGKVCLYNNFSGAEQRAIDLACLFAFMDIRKTQGDVSYNVSFYDELFDSSLDEKGVDLVLEILNERVKKFNECIFIISHRKESTKAATGNVIYLEKNNGITRRIKFVD